MDMTRNLEIGDLPLAEALDFLLRPSSARLQLRPSHALEFGDGVRSRSRCSFQRSHFIFLLQCGKLASRESAAVAASPVIFTGEDKPLSMLLWRDLRARAAMQSE
jgi:hypothetical protein